jgi:hypothetical protein
MIGVGDTNNKDIKGIGWECVGWVQLTQDAAQEMSLANSVVNFRIPKKAESFFTSWAASLPKS